MNRCHPICFMENFHQRKNEKQRFKCVFQVQFQKEAFFVKKVDEDADYLVIKSGKRITMPCGSGENIDVLVFMIHPLLPKLFSS